ncbi:MAG: hypothetical protein U0804_13215 [Gemmataceae bacterium]
MIPRVLSAAIAVCAALAAGCSSNPPARAEPVEVSGVALLPNGQPVKDVTLNFFPTSSAQVQTPVQLKADGKFTAKLIPGAYTFAFEGKADPMKAVPKKYHQNEADHKFDVPSGGTSGATVQLQN